MSEVFEGYERQYCELSANLSRKCNSAAILSDQGNLIQNSSYCVCFIQVFLLVSFDFDVDYSDQSPITI